ncbi:MAG: hypothetical protein OQL20_01890, partial [Sedimenticola sp.]|nr:hypothetical protein [Sedimenticola sp.]
RHPINRQTVYVRSSFLARLQQWFSTEASGPILMGMILLSVAHGLIPEFPRWLAGLLGWFAALTLIHNINTVQRTQVVAMLSIGTAGLVWGYFAGTGLALESAISTNQAMLAMLAAVSFLRLVTQPVTCDEALPMGNKPLWRTLFGIHLFGSVINMSSIVIIGDRLSANRPMTPAQACVLSRGFAMAACWSPFFAAMGIALSNAPGAQLTTLSLVGLPVALLALLLTGWELTRNGKAEHFHGYPMQFTALWIPGLLAALLMLTHQVWPEIPILTLISLLALSLTWLLLFLRHGRTGLEAYRQHIKIGLPRMSGELMLFISAGVLATGIAAAISATDLQVEVQQFGANEASLLLLVMVVVSVLGIHPVISIATAGGIFSPLGVDPNLLGMTFLMTWAIGISTAPLSGLHLMIQGRYNIQAVTLMKLNSRFALVMMGCGAVAMQLYEQWYL